MEFKKFYGKEAAKNYEGCNHHLSDEAIEAVEKAMKAHGNAPFDPRGSATKIHPGTVNELVAQSYLRHSADEKFVCTGKLVIGRKQKRQKRSA